MYQTGQVLPVRRGVLTAVQPQLRDPQDQTVCARGGMLTSCRWVPHPCYTISCCDDHDDLCLAEMEEPVVLPSYASVAGMDGSVGLPGGSAVVLIGMGATNSKVTRTLMEVQVPVRIDQISRSECCNEYLGWVLALCVF